MFQSPAAVRAAQEPDHPPAGDAPHQGREHPAPDRPRLLPSRSSHQAVRHQRDLPLWVTFGFPDHPRSIQHADFSFPRAPADLTVKARMQAGNAEGKSYASAFDGLRKIVAQEGARGLYKGIGPKLTQSVATVRFPPLMTGFVCRRDSQSLTKTAAGNRLRSSSLPRRRSTSRRARCAVSSRHGFSSGSSILTLSCFHRLSSRRSSRLRPKLSEVRAELTLTLGVPVLGENRGCNTKSCAKIASPSPRISLVSLCSALSFFLPERGSPCCLSIAAIEVSSLGADVVLPPAHVWTVRRMPIACDRSRSSVRMLHTSERDVRGQVGRGEESASVISS